MAHGPKPRDYTQRTPKKMKRLALRSALSARAAEAAIQVVEDFDWDGPKTRKAVSLLEAIGASGKTLVVLNSMSGVAARSFRNLPEVIMAEPGQITPYDVLWSDQILFTAATVGAVGHAGASSVNGEDSAKKNGEEF